MRADVALGAMLAAFFAAIVLAALDYRWEAAAAPLLAAASGLVLGAVLLIGSFRAVRLDEPNLFTRRDASAVATFAASIAAVLLLGFVLGGAVYIFACLRISAGFSLRNSAIAAVSTAAIIHFIFQGFVGAALFGGFLIERFAG